MTSRLVIGLDGGLATSGRVAIVTDGSEHECVGVDAWKAPKGSTDDIAVQDERVDRTMRYVRWIEQMASWRPAAIAVERMSFPRGAHAIAAICLSWGVIASFVERHRIPLVVAGPLEWRRAITTDGGSEDAAHRSAIRTVPSFARRAQGIKGEMHEHVLDALGVFCWSLRTSVVRAAVMT